MTDPAENLLALISHALLPMLDEGERAAVVFDHAPGAFTGDHVYKITVPKSQMGFALGTGGQNADALRRLSRAWARALGWRGARIDIRIVSAG